MSHRRREAVRALLALTTTAILAVTLWPDPQGPEGSSLAREIVEWLHAHGLPQAITFDVIEFVANIVMFVPFGLFLTLLLPRFQWWMTIAISAAFTLAIEVTQQIFLPERFASVSDLIANTGGGLIGALIVVAFVRSVD